MVVLFIVFVTSATPSPCSPVLCLTRMVAVIAVSHVLDLVFLAVAIFVAIMRLSGWF